MAPNAGAVEVAPNAGVADAAPNAGAAEVAPKAGAADVAPNPGFAVPNVVLPNVCAEVEGVDPNKPVDGCEVAVKPNPGVAGLKNFFPRLVSQF